MLDFAPIRNKQQTMTQLVAGLAPGDLRRLTNEMIDAIQGLVAECVDADVTFEPSDPGANDPAAATSAEVNMPWTLGHLIVHVTAVFVAPVTVAVNCCVPDGPTLALEGDTDTAVPPCTISIALIFGFSIAFAS